MYTLITGASGFLGRHLIAHLTASTPDKKVISVGRSNPQAPGLTHVGIDLCDPAAWQSTFARFPPSQVFHLAGGSRVTGRFKVPEYFQSNFLPTAGLADAVSNLSTPVSVFFASSVHVYGNQDGPVNESSAPHPISPYGFSKYLAEEVLRQFSIRSPLHRVVVARLYSCIGPGQGEGFVVSDLCRQLAGLTKTKPAVLKTGQLDGFRRFMDVRDTVRFFPILLAGPASSRFEIYNLASPHELEIKLLVQKLLSIAGVSPRVESLPDSTPNPFVGLHVSTEKMHRVAPSLGFRPLEETLLDTFNWVRQHYKSASRLV